MHPLLLNSPELVFSLCWQDVHRDRQEWNTAAIRTQTMCQHWNSAAFQKAALLLPQGKGFFFQTCCLEGAALPRKGFHTHPHTFLPALSTLPNSATNAL